MQAIFIHLSNLTCLVKKYTKQRGVNGEKHALSTDALDLRNSDVGNAKKKTGKTLALKWAAIQ